MSAPSILRQQLLRGHASSPLRLASPIVGRTTVCPSACIARSFHTQPPRNHASPAASKRLPLKTLSGGLMAAGGGFYYLSGHADPKASFSIYSPLESDSTRVDRSSTLLRPASPAAPRRQTVTLVFLTSQASSSGLVKSLVSNFGGGASGEREKWFSWIGYFREAGYDCLQMNLALPEAAEGEETEKLTDELHSQIRLSNLQRQPVLFVHHTADADAKSTSQIVSRYIEPSKASGASWWSKLFGAGGGMFGGRPAISGLVVISDLDDAQAMTLFGKHPKLNTLIVASGGASTEAHQGNVTVLDVKGKKHESVIKDVERWLIKEGYEG